MPFLFDKAKSLAELILELPDNATDMRGGHVADREFEIWSVVEFTRGKLEGEMAANFLAMLYTTVFPCGVNH